MPLLRLAFPFSRWLALSPGQIDSPASPSSTEVLSCGRSPLFQSAAVSRTPKLGWHLLQIPRLVGKTRSVRLAPGSSPARSPPRVAHGSRRASRTCVPSWADRDADGARAGNRSEEDRECPSGGQEIHRSARHRDGRRPSCRRRANSRAAAPGVTPCAWANWATASSPRRWASRSRSRGVSDFSARRCSARCAEASDELMLAV